MAEEKVLDKFIVSNLLNSNLSLEEKLHPWRYTWPLLFFRKPLLRTWDRFSGSLPDKNNRMNSRAPNKRLDTKQSRRESLETHINHRNWTETPFVSFTTSPSAVEELATKRRLSRGLQTLTVIDPNTRLRKGLPILNCAAEMERYGIQNPYGERNRYFVEHYLCLWQVTEDEIIGHWNWDELSANENWYKDIVIPAFRNFSRSSVAQVEGSGHSIIKNGLYLHGESPGVAYNSSQVARTFDRGYTPLSDDGFWVLDDSAEECYYGEKYHGWDSYDSDEEVELANLSDN